jgi:hypothetical protein
MSVAFMDFLSCEIRHVELLTSFYSLIVPRSEIVPDNVMPFNHVLSGKSKRYCAALEYKKSRA